jgi:hypothetical protein
MERLVGSTPLAGASDYDEIMAKLAKLHDAVASGITRSRCLRRWSEFIRERDGHRCVDCHSRERLSAHHICRKTFFAKSQFETGNGITLCRDCHREAHRGFNGRPDLSLPVDAQGGEKLAFMERLYSILLDDAVERGMMCDDFYFLSGEVLDAFKRMQGHHPHTSFPGSAIEQAYLILAGPERQVRFAIAEANGFVIDDQPLLPGGRLLALGSDGAQQSDRMVIRTYVPRSA